MRSNYSLNPEPPTRYSKSEQQIFGLLSAVRKPSSDIANWYYARKVPLHGRKVIIGLLTGLRRKVELNREPFRIMATRRAGPLPVSFWLEKVK